MWLFGLQVEYDEFHSVSVLGTSGDPHIIPVPNAEIPLQVFIKHLIIALTQPSYKYYLIFINTVYVLTRNYFN